MTNNIYPIYDRIMTRQDKIVKTSIIGIVVNLILVAFKATVGILSAVLVNPLSPLQLSASYTSEEFYVASSMGITSVVASMQDWASVPKTARRTSAALLKWASYLWKQA